MAFSPLNKNKLITAIPFIRCAVNPTLNCAGEYCILKSRSSLNHFDISSLLPHNLHTFYTLYCYFISSH